LVVPGLAASGRGADCGMAGARFRFVVFVLLISFFGDCTTDGGEVKLMSSMPPVLEAVLLEAMVDGFGVMGAWKTPSRGV
jgi:hypothetical protein